MASTIRSQIHHSRPVGGDDVVKAVVKLVEGVVVARVGAEVRNIYEFLNAKLPDQQTSHESSCDSTSKTP